MFHLVRVDGGKEFFLSLGIQEIFSDMRNRQATVPYRKTESHEKHANYYTHGWAILPKFKEHKPYNTIIPNT